MMLKRERLNNNKLGYLNLQESQFCINEAFSTSRVELNFVLQVLSRFSRRA